ncbi:PAS domain-containing protein [Dongia sp. agr-C8]
MEPTFVTELQAPEAATLKRLQAYWEGKKGDRPAPPKSAIDPAELRDLLPDILLIDVVGDPPRFRARLFGSALVAAYGEEVTGKFGEEVDLDAVHDELMRFVERAAAQCKPQYLRTAFTKRGGRHLRYEQIILPLSDDGRKTNMLLSAYWVEAAYG